MRDAEEVAAQLTRAAELTFTRQKFLNADDPWIRFILASQKTSKNPATDPNGRLRDVRDISVKYQPELGGNASKGQRMHIHGRIKIQHFKFIRMETKKIEIEYNRNLTEVVGCEHPIMYFHWQKEPLTNKQYTQKFAPPGEGPTEEEAEDFFGDELKFDTNEFPDEIPDGAQEPIKGFTTEDFEPQKGRLETMLQLPLPNDFSMKNFAQLP